MYIDPLYIVAWFVSGLFATIMLFGVLIPPPRLFPLLDFLDALFVFPRTQEDQGMPASLLYAVTWVMTGALILGGFWTMLLAILVQMVCRISNWQKERAHSRHISNHSKHVSEHLSKHIVVK
jgi:hypothetical protein